MTHGTNPAHPERTMEQVEERAVLGGLLAVIALTATDIGFDLYLGGSMRHIVVELAVIVVAAAGVVWRWRRTMAVYNDRLRQSEARGERWHADAERWRSEAAQLLQGLSEAIQRQFEQWALTESEQEVAFLLLKGLSLKEVAEVRGVAEKTIRNQTLSIYSKGGLAGRAELSAYFLEDLLQPPRRDG